MSATVDVSDSLEEARTRLLRSARALNAAWLAVLCSMLGLVIASLGLLLVAVTIRPVYVVIWSTLLAATGCNLTRFWPRRREPVGRTLDREDAAALRRLLDPDRTLPWPDAVRLVPRPELELGEGELVLGLPLLACLAEEELRELVALAARQASVEDERAVRWALRVAHGEIGRPLVGRRPRMTWATSVLTENLRDRAAGLEADLGNWAFVLERAAAAGSPATAAAIAARHEVADAWALLGQEWLQPASARGRRHVAPFTGLRHFVEGADAAGWLSERRPWRPPTGVVAELVARHEEAVALELDPRGDRLVPLSWEQHPVEVTLPQWRALVTEVLDAARRTTYDPAVTLETVLALLEAGRGPELAGALATERHRLAPGESAQEWSERFPARVLTAAIAVAAVDSRRFVPGWSWPEGTRLTSVEDGWTLPLESVVTEVLGMVRDGGGLERAYAELREALEQLGIDVHEPLWLDHDAALHAERPLGSFPARQGLAARLVVVTDRALHVFRDPQGLRLGGLLRPHGPRDAAASLQARMLTVWQGETTGQLLRLAADDVRRARLGPATGGLWWRLTLTCDDEVVVLRGRGDGQAEEAELREWLGPERVERSWLAAAPAVRSVRNAVGLVGTGLGTLALLGGVLLTVVAPGGMPDVLPTALAVGGFAALVVAVLPDAVLELAQRGRRQRLGSTEPVVD